MTITRRHTAIALLAFALVPAAVFAQEVQANQNYVEFGLRGAAGTVDGRTNPGDVPFSYGFQPEVLTSGLNTYRDYRNSVYLSRAIIERAFGKSRYVNLQSANNGVAFKGDTFTRDQSFLFTTGEHGKDKYQFRWDQTPHIFSGTTRSLFRETQPGVWVFTGDRAVLDAARVAGTAAAFSSAISQQIGDAPVVVQRILRKNGTGLADVNVNPNVNLAASFTHETQLGTRPLGMCFGNSPSCVWSEIPENLDFATNTLQVKTKVGDKSWKLGLGYRQQNFDNRIPSQIVDNPFSNNVNSPSVTSQGQMGLYPDNEARNLLFDGTWKRGPLRIVTSITPGWLTQNEPFVPYTTNSFLLGRSGVQAPIPLPASSLDGERRTLAMNYSAIFKATKNLDVVARYRQYDNENHTEEHVFNPYVGDLEAEAQLTTPGGSGQVIKEFSGLFAQVDPNCAGVCNEPISFHTKNLDLNSTWFFTKTSSVKVQYAREWFDRHHRDVERTVEDVVKGAVDLKPTTDLTLRVAGTYQNRTPHGVDYPWYLVPGTQRPDEGFRRRNRVDLLAEYDLTDRLNVSTFYGTTRDDLNRRSETTSLTNLGDPAKITTLGPPPTPLYGPYYVYGLLKEKNSNYGGDFDYLLTEDVTVYGEYSRENGSTRMVSRQRSANTASQVGCPSATLPQDCDPINDWMTLMTDVVDAYFVGVDTTFHKNFDVSTYYSLAVSKGTTFTDGMNCQIGAGPNAFCRTNFPNWRLDTAASPAVTFSFPDSTSRLHEAVVIGRLKLSETLVPRFEYRFQRFMYNDYQTSVINPLSFVGPAVDPGGATGLQRMLFLGADIPGYRAHIFSLTLEYHF